MPAATPVKVRLGITLFVAWAVLLVSAPSASALAPPLAPTSCTFTRSGDTATITWTPAANDGADRYVIDRNRNNLGWSWADRIDLGEPLESTNTVAAADTVQFRVKARAGNDTSPTTTCTEQQSNSWTARANWELNEPSGSSTVIDTAGNANGFLGRSSDLNDDGDVTLNGDSYGFNGADDSVVFAPVSSAVSDLLNPVGGEFRWTTEISMPQSAIDTILGQSSVSWNVMQRGLADNAGGQWKTQIIVRSGAPRAECIVRDGSRFNGDGERLFISAKSLVNISAGTQYTIVCEYDDVADALSISVNGVVAGPVTLNQVRFPGATFGDVDPTGSTSCANPGRLGNVITFGNKPACSAIDDNDRFIGTIHQVAVHQR